MPPAQAPIVNLLSKKKASYDAALGVAVKAKSRSMIVLVVYVVLLAGVMLVNIFLSRQVGENQAQINQAKMALLSKSVVIQQYQQLLSRAKTVQQLFKKRLEIAEMWSQIQTSIPVTAEFNSFSFDNNQLSVGLLTPHILSANETLNSIQTGFGISGITSSTTGLGRAEDASYKVSVELSFGKTGKEK